MQHIITTLQDGAPVELLLPTRRERRILALVTAGYSNKEIAARMPKRGGGCITEGTVKEYLATLFEDLRATTRMEVARWVLSNPRVLAGQAVSPGLHPLNCQCGSCYCAVMRQACSENQDLQEAA